MNLLAYVIGSWADDQIVVVTLILIFSLFLAKKFMRFDSEKIMKIFMIFFFFIVARVTFIPISGLVYLKYSDKNLAFSFAGFAFILVLIFGLVAILIRKDYVRLVLCCAVLFVKPCFSKLLYG